MVRPIKTSVITVEQRALTRKDSDSRISNPNGMKTAMHVLLDWGSDSNGAKSHVKGRSWDRLASQDLSPSVSQGTIRRYVAVDGRLGYA